jgi:predicted nucleic acid-binding protein
VDSSVWIDFFRGDQAAAAAIATLSGTRRVVICGQIKQEVLQGSRDKSAFEKLEQRMSIWEYEAESPEDFVAAARIFAELRWKGVTIPPSDCLIAAIAKRLNMPVYSTDADFDSIPNLPRFRMTR